MFNYKKIKELKTDVEYYRSKSKDSLEKLRETETMIFDYIRALQIFENKSAMYFCLSPLYLKNMTEELNKKLEKKKFDKEVEDILKERELKRQDISQDYVSQVVARNYFINPAQIIRVEDKTERVKGYYPERYYPNNT